VPPSIKSRQNRAGQQQEVPPSLGEFMNPMATANDVGDKLTSWASDAADRIASGDAAGAAKATKDQENENAKLAHKQQQQQKLRPTAAGSKAGAARQHGALLFILVPLLIGVFFIVPTIEREEQFMQKEMAVEEKENHRFVEDEAKLVQAEHMNEESVTVADNADLDGDGLPDGIEMHPNETAVGALYKPNPVGTHPEL
jgi:hypothetical protein